MYLAMMLTQYVSILVVGMLLLKARTDLRHLYWLIQRLEDNGRRNAESRDRAHERLRADLADLQRRFGHSFLDAAQGAFTQVPEKGRPAGPRDAHAPRYVHDDASVP